jgi:hypothetical protein
VRGEPLPAASQAFQGMIPEKMDRATFSVSRALGLSQLDLRLGMLLRLGVRPRAARSGSYAPAVEPQCRVLLCGQQTSAEFSRYKEVFGNRQQWNLSTRS